MDRRSFIAASVATSLALPARLQAQSGNTLRRVVASEMTSLDPQRPTGQVTAEMAAELFAGLTVTDANGRVVPGCAANWQTSPDGLTWTFKLRPKLQWSDGTALTARDFVFTLRRYLDPETGAPNAVRLDSIVGARDIRFARKRPETLGVTAPDASTLVIRLEHPDVELPLNLCTAYCVPEHVVKVRGREWSKPEYIVSNGPYRIESWAAGAKDVKLIKNTRFFDAALVAIERVEWLTGYDDGTRLRLFKLGQADIASIEDMGNLSMAKRELPAFLRSSPECALGAIGINVSRKPLDNPDIRRALTLAVDRSVIAGKVRGLGERPLESVLPPGITQYPKLQTPDAATWPMPKRLEAARALMQKARGGARLKLGIGFPTNPTTRKVYLAIAAMWKPIGIDLELLPIDGRAYSAAIQRGDYDLFSYAMFAVIPSASVFLDRFVSDSTINVSRYKNAAYDRAFLSAERQATIEARFAAYAEAEKLLLQDVPLLPLWAGVSNRLVAKRVGGWVDHPAHSHPSRYLKI